MIHVIIYQNSKKKISGFRTIGHAGFADEGQDVVCAAASILVINTINAIECFTKDKASLVSDDLDGVIEYQLKGNSSEQTELLLKTMVMGLQAMSDDDNYAEYIDLTFEEV